MPDLDPPPPANARARRAERLAVAQAVQGAGLDWAAIDACPAWLARPAAERDLLCVHAGAWWLGAALRGCIDGQRLAQVCELLGEARLNALRDAPAIARAQALGQAPHPLLPPAEDVPRHLVACGRALLGWSLPAAVREPVLAHLGWTVDEGHCAAFDACADWARQALQAALDDTAPPGEDGALARTAVLEQDDDVENPDGARAAGSRATA